MANINLVCVTAAWYTTCLYKALICHCVPVPDLYRYLAMSNSLSCIHFSKDDHLCIEMHAWGVHVLPTALVLKCTVRVAAIDNMFIALPMTTYVVKCRY